MKMVLTAQAACALMSALAGCVNSQPPVTSHGTLTIYVDPLGGVSIAQGYPDITDGGQVTVTDSSGKVIGTGSLSYSQEQSRVSASIEASMLGSGVSAS